MFVNVLQNVIFLHVFFKDNFMLRLNAYNVIDIVNFKELTYYKLK